MANNPREVWAQMQPETPFSRYPVPNPQPSPGIAGIVQNIGQGAGNALAYRRELEKNYQAAAAAVAEAEMKALSEAASEKAKQDAAMERVKEEQKGQTDRANATIKANAPLVSARTEYYKRMPKATAGGRGGLTDYQAESLRIRREGIYAGNVKAWRQAKTGLWGQLKTKLGKEATFSTGSGASMSGNAAMAEAKTALLAQEIRTGRKSLDDADQEYIEYVSQLPGWKDMETRTYTTKTTLRDVLSPLAAVRHWFGKKNIVTSQDLSPEAKSALLDRQLLLDAATASGQAIDGTGDAGGAGSNMYSPADLGLEDEE